MWHIERVQIDAIAFERAQIHLLKLLFNNSDNDCDNLVAVIARVSLACLPRARPFSLLPTTGKRLSSYVYDDNRDDDDDNDHHHYADVVSPRLLSMVLAFML